MMRRVSLILLDRDGVINEDLTPNGVLHPSDMRLLSVAREALSLLCTHRIPVAIVTNQSAIGKGLLTHEGLEAIHARMFELLGDAGACIQRIYYCADAPHAPTPRRKPGDGMLREALHDFCTDAASAAMIGDSLRDLQAAASVGCARYLVRTGKGETTMRAGLPDAIAPVTVCADVLEAIRCITH